MQPDNSYAQAMAQMRENCARDLPWFVGANVGGEKDWLVVAGGPSMRSRLADIRQRQAKGACVCACNGAVKFLLSHGIKPDIITFLDISPEVLGFIPEEDTGALYLIASTVHPLVLQKLEGRRVVLWHCDYGEGRSQDQAAIIKEYPDKPGSLIGGGNTIAMRAPHLGHLLGFKTIRFYGLDSSFSEDGEDHAYKKHSGSELGGEVIGYKGKKYMSKQLKKKLLSIWDLPLKEQERILDESFLEWKGSLEQVDDVTVVGIRI